MITRLRFVFAAAFVCCLVALPATAQDQALSVGTAPGQAPANLAYIEGGVDLVHEGIVERAVAPALLLDGDIIRTGDGRAEIVFGDGSLLYLDSDTEVELLSPERVRLRTGRVSLRVSAAAAARYVVDTVAASVRMDARGEYGVIADQRRGSLDLTVSRGIAEVADNGQRVIVRAGERLSLLGPGTRGLLEPFNTARWDSFDQWANDRANGFATSVSSRQLPVELRPYGPVLDQYGRWDYDASHGYVWFPSVGAGWRPYYDGSWAHTRYGWTWIGAERWYWPTHHYGRWGFNGAFWFWKPLRGWSSAWVSWAFAPGFVSWCPLGFDGRPVVGFWGRPGDHLAYRPHYSPWRAWTIVPRDHFGPRRHVRNFAVDGDRLDAPTRGALIVQNAPPPAPVGNAVPRGTLSVGVADGAMPRSEAPAPRNGAVRRPSAVGSVYPPLPPRRGDDPPAAASRERSGDRDASPPRRYDTPGAVRVPPPVEAPPPSGYTLPPAGDRATRSTAQDRAPRDAERPVDRGTARPRGAGRDPGYAPRSEGQSPPPASRPESGSRPAGAVRRGDSAPARQAPPSGPPPSASEGSGGGGGGGGARRRPPV
jgi:hypothetical protein